ncbi:MAG: hypothetical protein HKN74_12225 [Acidimicrobiia bacterium]|nr:carbohydrate kinase family protein [Acidimicrobiia bacterium]MBT8216037.1 carbohydrate kinase family protein [Acidimicrobiia bacterium]NNF11042.1 hypothetical protein [Acidimicrobiia bacterium]NNL68751.1 hypothetical protein [Acidimicrobiia bacterium]
MVILVYGSLVPDIVFSVPRLPMSGEDVPASAVSFVPAGGGGNIATALARWGHAVRVSGNSVGTDPLGSWVATAFEELGISLPAGFVDVDGVTVPNGILVTPDGQRTIIGSDYRRVHWLPAPDWTDVRAVAVDGYSGEAGAEVIEHAARLGVPVVGADRTGPETAHLTALLWSGAEHPDEAAAVQVAATGPAVVVTRGPDPIDVFLPDGSRAQIAPTPVEGVDTTGAGDAFTAAVAASLGAGDEIVQAVRSAALRAASYVAAGRDATPPPTARMGP